MHQDIVVVVCVYIVGDIASRLLHGSSASIATIFGKKKASPPLFLAILLASVVIVTQVIQHVIRYAIHVIT